MPDHQVKKRKLIIWTTLSVLAVLIIWGFSLQFTWPEVKEGESFAWPEWNPSENSIKDELDNLMSKLNQQPEEKTAEREILANPDQLSEEEIKQIEEDIFPKEKNAQEENND